MTRNRRLMPRTLVTLFALLAVFALMRPAAVKAEGPWSALGGSSGIGALNGPVNAIAVSGSDVYVGGNFTNAGGNLAADYIAKWNGSTWSALGSQQVCPPPFFQCHDEGLFTGIILAVAVSGSDVYVGGPFSNSAGVGANSIAKWSTATSTWSNVGNNNGLSNTVRTLVVANGLLYAGGLFRNAGGIPEADAIATWDGTTWGALGSYDANVNSNFTSDGAILCTQALSCYFNTAVNAIAVDGTNVYVGCTDCRDVGGDPTVDNVLMWDGLSWHGLGTRIDLETGLLNGPIWEASTVTAIQLAPDGSVYFGGNFLEVANLPATAYLARWDGNVWSPVGPNGAISAMTGFVKSMALFGTDLYVGGWYLNANGDPLADGILKWSGTAWSTLGSNGANGALSVNGVNVNAVAVSATDLFVGGEFFDAGGITTADNIARWNILAPSLTSIVVTPANQTIPAGTDRQFTATGGYSDGSTGDVTNTSAWASSQTSVATINAATGLAHGVAESVTTTVITATKDLVSGSVTLTVGAPVLVSLAVTPANPTIPLGTTQQFTATGTYSDASVGDVTGSVTWASLTPSVATINAAGLATGAGLGQSTIRATKGAVTASTTLTVGGPLPVLLYTGPVAAQPGATITLSATLKTSTGLVLSNRNVTFTLDGALLTAKTNNKGAASVRTVSPATTGSFPIQVNFAGDPGYSAASTSSSLDVKFATKVTYTGPSRVSANAAITLTATLQTSTGAAIAGRQVSFNVNGSVLAATTNASGVASVNTTAPAAGKYSIAIGFAGDAGYGASSASATLTAR